VKSITDAKRGGLMTRSEKVMIIGQLGRDPEMRYTPSGRPVTSFSVSSSRNWVTSEGERREETEWFNVVTWGGLAEICKQHLHKGQTIYVEGRLQTRGWEDQEGKNICTDRRQRNDHLGRSARRVGGRARRRGRSGRRRLSILTFTPGSTPRAGLDFREDSTWSKS
jgi:single-strand DNA-binding protein